MPGLLIKSKLNSVALISLFTALFELSYNTYLHQHNEVNYNMRLAAFEVLKDLAELHTVVNYAHYDKDKFQGNPIDDWKNIVMIRDMTRLLPPDTASAGQGFKLGSRIWKI